MRLNPFAGLEHPRTIWAWGMFDLANQSFTLLINTLLFPLFFRAVVVGDEGRDDLMWSFAVAISFGIVVLTSPIMGAIADSRACKKHFLVTLGAICALLTIALSLVPSAGANPTRALAIAMLMYIPANVAYQLGENFLAAFLPEIAKREQIGRVSGLGWAMGYVGALLLLIIVIASMAVLGLDQIEQWRPYFVLAGLWFIVMALPTVLFLHEKARPDRQPGPANPIREGLTRVAHTLKQAREFSQLGRFLLAFLIYGFGVQVVIFFAAPIMGDFGFEGQDMVVYVAVLTIFAGITAIATSRFQDRLGHQRTIVIFLVVWTLNALALAYLADLKAHATNPTQFPRWPLQLIGVGFGIGLGGIGTASRAMVGAFTPQHRTAEFFGLWGLTYKLAGCLGVLSFGVCKDLLGDIAALLTLASFFVVGFLVLLTVDQGRGVAAAEASEEAHERGVIDA